MFLYYLYFAFVFICCFTSTFTQESSNGYLNYTNLPGETDGTLLTTDSQESNIWLLTKDSPIPAQLNRAWSPENGYPGVQHITTLRRNNYSPSLRVPQSSIDILQNRNENIPDARDILVYTPESTIQRHEGSSIFENPQTQTGSNFQAPGEAVLVELPAHLTSGFWERPRPQFMEQLSSSPRRVGSSQELDFIQFDSGSVINGQNTSPDTFLPTKEASDRLPISTVQSPNENKPVESNYEHPYQAFFIPTPDYNNETVLSVPAPPSNQDVWFPSESRTALDSPIVLEGNDGKLFYEFSYDEFPPTSSSHESIGLTLTKDDIEILEKLGILSALNLEPTEFVNSTHSEEFVENPQREYQSHPQLIKFEDQNFPEVSEERFDRNLSDVDFVQVPEFLASEYHANIPATDESRDPTRTEPLISFDQVLLKGNESLVNGKLESHVYNGTSLSPAQIQEILQLLGLSNEDYYNISSISTTTAKPLFEALTTPAPESENATTNPEVSSTNTPSVIVSNGSKLIPVKTSVSTSISRSFLATPELSDTSERSKLSQGLVSSGRIQPRLLDEIDSDKMVNENEVLQMISRRMSPMSAQKLEMLRKLKLNPKPYVFGFHQDDGNGTRQHRNETADGFGIVKGTYGYRDPSGVYRNVNYIADNNGFHAVVRTNEPGTVSQNSADVIFRAELPPKAAVAQMMAYARARTQNNNS
ncbi:cuticle protein 10.9 [Trichonephila clavata]|uniref:Cuticle protein 10.9 n=1 Tax=Trichonephila clavata TaxID=2740835 RepID=A0A8X6GAL5_TRICU|nr:cuticle protein 10.9 [Trichonephila clavata]